MEKLERFNRAFSTGMMYACDFISPLLVTVYVFADRSLHFLLLAIVFAFWSIGFRIDRWMERER